MSYYVYYMSYYVNFEATGAYIAILLLEITRRPSQELSHLLGCGSDWVGGWLVGWVSTHPIGGCVDG